MDSVLSSGAPAIQPHCADIAMLTSQLRWQKSCAQHAQGRPSANRTSIQSGAIHRSEAPLGWLENMVKFLCDSRLVCRLAIFAAIVRLSQCLQLTMVLKVRGYRIAFLESHRNLFFVSWSLLLHSGRSTHWNIPYFPYQQTRKRLVAPFDPEMLNASM